MKKRLILIAAMAVLVTGCEAKQQNSGKAPEPVPSSIETTQTPAVSQTVPSISPKASAGDIVLKQVPAKESLEQFPGCKTDFSEYESDYAFNRMIEEGEFERKMNTDFAQINITYEISGIEKPLGVLLREKDVLVCDNGKSELVRLGLDGKRLETIGKLGNKEGEFLNPTAIKEYDGNIYVLDSGNSRVNIFDEELNYVCKIVYPEVVTITDFELDNNGNFYFSCDPFAKTEARVYYADMEKETFARVDGVFASRLGRNKETVYAINMNVLYVQKNENSYDEYYGRIVVTPGETYMFKLEDGGVVDTHELIFGYRVSDFLGCGDEFYFAGLKLGVGAAIDKARAPEYQYMETYEIALGEDKYSADEAYMDMDGNGNIAVSSLDSNGEYGTVTLFMKKR